ncbi:MAG: hypothetical protein ACJ73E_00205 [Mycobacteriales bacterium]
MTALSRRRPVRHVLLGLLPLLVAGVAVLVVLGERFAGTAAPVREATARAPATVVRSGAGPDGRDVELRWTAADGFERVSTVRAARAGEVPAGRTVQLRYPPANPSGQVFVAGDETSVRLRDLAFGMLLTVLVVVGVLVATGVHLARRLAAERRPGTTLPARYARSRRGLVQRSWLVLTEQGRDWWVPVHWDPVLLDLAAGTPVTVHGRPARDRVVVVDVGGTTVWQAGRRRAAEPRGALPGPDAGDPAAVPVGVLRQLRSDAALLVVAPIAGLLWAYLDESGAASWAAATALVAGVLVWLPTVAGSDPT